jgi:hypothetical protein
MDPRAFRNIFAALGLLLFQVAVLNEVSLFGLGRPFVYPMILLVLPFDSNRAGVLGLAFVLGLILDSFSNTPGLHAASLVLVAWLRPHVADLLTPKAGYEGGDRPRIASLGPIWFVPYAGILLAAHHTAFFVLEVFSFAAFGRILGHILLSGLVSLLLVVVLEYLFGPPLERKSLSR